MADGRVRQGPNRPGTTSCALVEPAETRKRSRAVLHGSESSGGRGIFVRRTDSDSCAGNGAMSWRLGFCS